MDAPYDPFTERVARELEKLIPDLNAERSYVGHWLEEHAKGCLDEAVAARRILDGVSLKVVMQLHGYRDLGDTMES